MNLVTEQHMTYRDKLRGCWLGKNIGGTLGGPFEGNTAVNNLTFYRPVPKGALPNDDLDLQLAWLVALERYGLAVTGEQLADLWSRHYQLGWAPNEYFLCIRNFRRGVRPPACGAFDNAWSDSMGAPIRSEIWACLAPGEPARAAGLSCRDSTIDHAGEGVYGEAFLAALESAAFVESDVDKILDCALSLIPETCCLARKVAVVRECRRAGDSWLECREKVLAPPNIGDAPLNLGFVVLGLLYGQDFGDALCKAVNCGHDTDCTGATLGALLGILHGAQKLPAKWVRPIGQDIVASRSLTGLNVPRTVDEFVERLVVLRNSAGGQAPRRAGASRVIRIGRQEKEEVLQALREDRRYSLLRCGPLTIRLAFDPEPAVTCGGSVRLNMSVTSSVPWQGTVELRVPYGWSVGAGSRNRALEVRPDRPVHKEFLITASKHEEHVPFANELVLAFTPKGQPCEFVRFGLVGPVRWTAWGPYPARDLRAWDREPWPGAIPDRADAGLPSGGRLLQHTTTRCDLEPLFRGKPGVVYLGARLAFFTMRAHGRLMVASSAFTKVWLDGKPFMERGPDKRDRTPLAELRTARPYGPAPHVTFLPGTDATLDMDSGDHVLFVKVLRGADPAVLDYAFETYTAFGQLDPLQYALEYRVQPPRRSDA